ncbi:MAG: DNA primase [Leptotrichiaceae bacterium]|nr:DNA primase [Leptotrichiaceae bacterium]
MYKDTDIQKLIDELDIVQVIGEYVTLKRTGANYKGLSPFREEKTPSFVVSPTKNIFKDFSTGIGGNVISFYMKINNLTFVEALEELARKYDINIKKLNTNKEKANKNSKYYEIMREAQSYFSVSINNSEEALKYMNNRDFSIEDIRKFEIGFSLNKWDGLLNYLNEKKYDTNDLIELGLVRKNENGNIFDYYRNRIIFPIYNDSMKLVGFGGRTIEKDSSIPKYVNSPDSKIFKKGKELFGLYNKGENIRKKGLAILMEGYLDVLTAHKYGFNNSIASLGTSFTNEQAELLKKYTQNVIIAYDNDDAGTEAIIKVANILKRNDFNIRCLTIENEVKDPDEYLRKYGRKKFLEILKTSKNIFEFLYDYFSKNLNLNEILGKRELISRFKDFFASIQNRTEMNLYIQKLSVELNIDKDVLIEEFVRKESKNNRRFTKKNVYKEKVISKLPKEEKYNDLEKDTLKYILKYKSSKSSKYENHCKNLENKQFNNIIYGEIIEKLKDIKFDIIKIDNLTLEEEEKEIITTLKLQSEIDIQDEEKQYKDIFVGWFLREIELMREIIDKKDEVYIKLQWLKSELKIIHNINEIEEMYNQFMLIRRSENV